MIHLAHGCNLPLDHLKKNNHKTAVFKTFENKKTPQDFSKLFVLLCSLTTSKMAVFVGCRIESILKDVLLISFATMLGFRTKQTKTDDSME